MSTFRRNAPEVVALYTVSGLSLRAIGDRFGVSYEAVRLLLIEEGVELRSRSHSVSLAQAARRGREQAARHVEAQATPDALEREDCKHVNAVITALCGRGFPFLSLPGGVAA